MKPFDLGAALWGEPVVTRDGRRVLQVVHLSQAHESCRVVAVVESEESIFPYQEDGRYLTSDNTSRTDLLMPPRTFTLGGIEVPLPEREAPPVGTRYYVPDVTCGRLNTTSHEWASYSEDWHEDWHRLRSGLVHLVNGSAAAHAEAMVRENIQRVAGDRKWEG